MTIPAGWASRDCDVVLDNDRAAGMWKRVAQFGRERGGCFSRADDATILVWSGGAAVPDAVPVGAATVEAGAERTVVRSIAWDAARADAHVIWRGLSLLVGRPAEPARVDPPAYGNG